MSLLINGMEMPNDYKHRDVTLDRTTDDGILRLSVYDFDHEAMKYSCRVYSLTEIPTPHGDLIDRDDLLAYFEKESKGKTAEEALKLLYTALKAYPVVIGKEMN